MKKILLFASLMLILFGVGAFITHDKQAQKSKENVYKKSSLHPATIDLLNNKDYNNIILPEKLKKKLDEKEDVTVYFFSSTCSHCKEATPIITSLANELNVPVFKYNVLEFEQGREEYHIEGTPTLIHFKSGKEASRIMGAKSKEIFQNWFETHVLN